MKLLFCIKSMNNRGGGAERVLADIAGSLAKRGHSVAVLSFDSRGGRSFYPLDSRIERIELGIGSTTGKATLRTTLYRIVALRGAVRSYAPDVVIGFMHSMFIPLGFALLGTSSPMIASEHIVPEHYRSRPIEGMLLCIVPLLVNCIICVSEQVRRSYPSFIQKKMVTVVNPVNIATRRQADVSGSQKNRKVLLTVGRLEPQKDHRTLIDAFALIAHQLPEWNLRIVGDGELRPELQSRAVTLGLSDRVELPGTTTNVSKEYLSAQLFVQPSRYESFGLATAEAFAHGLPVVGFDNCQGTNQLIRPGINGFLACGNDHRTLNLAKAIKSLMKDEELRVSLSKQSKDSLEQFSLDKVVIQWEKLLKRVKNPKSQP